nr:leucine-rich repeat domain-containing protein [Clostridia bacterium]
MDESTGNKALTLHDDTWYITNGVLENFNGNGEKVVIIPPGVTEVDISAFLLEDEIETIIVSDTVKKLEYSSFDSLDSLKTLYLPDNGLQLCPGFICNCTSLKEIYLGENKLEFVTAAYEDDSEYTYLVTYAGDKSDVIVPDGYKEIGESAFRKNKNINSVALPQGITRVDSCAFKDCDNLS